MGICWALYIIGRTKAFKRYVIGSPWQEWNHPTTFELEESYVEITMIWKYCLYGRVPSTSLVLI